MTVWLASTSPRRRRLTRQLGIPFRLVRPDAAEQPPTPDNRPEAYATANALAKATSAARKVGSGFIIGVDTVVALRDRIPNSLTGRILGKPESPEQACMMLRQLSGRTHAVITGIAVVRKPGNRKLTGAETSLVGFRRLTGPEIERYVATPEPHDKAGAYAIQKRGGGFVRHVSGSYLNVVGLPVRRLLDLLHRAGWRVPQGVVLRTRRRKPLSQLP